MTHEKPTVLLVDRESEQTRALLAFLHQNDLDVIWTRDGEGAFHALDEERVDCLVTELRVHRIDGMEVLKRARIRNPEVCAVVVAAGGDIPMAVEAMRQGAYDFQVKPLNFDKLLAVLRRGLSHQQVAARVVELEGKLDARVGLEPFTGRSRAITRVIEQIRHVASTRGTVLIEGEPGSGKSLVARAIHLNSPRKDERFAWIDCSALTGREIESELFGQEQDTVPGSGAARRGAFELADGGTLFMDEIGEAPPAVQARLLRFLQEREFERVGGQETLRVDVRLVAATSRDLAGDVEAGRFREDLCRRLSVVRIAMPPLRERRADIPLLVEAFLREFNREHGRRVTGITRGGLERLMRYPWPGNVRELRDAIEGMVVFAKGRRPLELSDLPAALREVESEGEGLGVAVGMTVARAERLLIAATLEHTGFDKPRAAAMLGIGLRTLYRKIKRFGLR